MSQGCNSKSGKWRNSDDLFKCIKAIHNYNGKVNYGSLRHNFSKEISKIIYTTSGVDTTGDGLVRSAISRLGSWDNALRHSGFDPTLIRKDIQTEWSEQQIIKAILALYSENIRLSSGKIRLDRSEKTRNILFKSVGKNNSGKSFYITCIRYFGSWKNALLTAGLDPDSIKSKPGGEVFWTKDRISTVIDELHSSNIDLSAAHFQKDKSSEVRDILQKASFGSCNSGSGLISAATREFGSWNKALSYSGLRPERISRRPWTKATIIESIKALNLSDIPLTYSNLISPARRSEVSKIIQNSRGVSKSGASLLGAAKLHFGNWNAALIEAGINPRTIVGERWNKEHIVTCIRELNKYQHPLNAISIRDNRYLIESTIKSTRGVPRTGSSLLWASYKYFGSWDQALKSAGFDPYKIRLTLPGPTSNLVITPHQIEWVKDNRGINRRNVYFGESPKTPEQILTEHEDVDHLQMAIRALYVEDQWMIEGLLKSNIELDSQIGSHDSVRLSLSDIRIAKILSALKVNLGFIREIEQLNEMLLRYCPSTYQSVLLELPSLFDEFNSLVENRSEKKRDQYPQYYQIGKILERIESNFRAFAEVVCHIHEYHHYDDIVVELAGLLQQVRYVTENNSDSSAIKWCVFCFKKKMTEIRNPPES